MTESTKDLSERIVAKHDFIGKFVLLLVPFYFAGVLIISENLRFNEDAFMPPKVTQHMPARNH